MMYVAVGAARHRHEQCVAQAVIVGQVDWFPLNGASVSWRRLEEANHFRERNNIEPSPAQRSLSLENEWSVQGALVRPTRVEARERIRSADGDCAVLVSLSASFPDAVDCSMDLEWRPRMTSAATGLCLGSRHSAAGPHGRAFD